MSLEHQLTANPGAKSTVRSMMYPEIQLESSWNCYRAVIDGKVFKENPEIEHLMDEANLWWGKNRTIVGVPVQNKSAYSLELAHPGNTGTAGEWSKRGDVDEMKAMYSDFEPVIVKLMEHVKPEDLLVWKMVQLPQQQSWSMKSGRVLLIADGKTSQGS
jgi:salicylate hydroxylase